MNLKESLYSRRLFLSLLFLSGCATATKSRGDQLVIGTVSYDAGEEDLRTYERFQRYLGEQLKVFVQLEPAFSHNKALERVKAGAWGLVFAPPGLAAIAIAEHQYVPLFPLQGINTSRSVLVVPQNSPLRDRGALVGKRLAIGQPGSATGYYFPIFNLYGLTLAELVVSATPKDVLSAVVEGRADAGALSLEEFNQLKTSIPGADLRILMTDPHSVPPGAILLSPRIDRTFQESIRKLLSETPSMIAQETGFIPTEGAPDYQYMISVVKRVRAIFPADETREGAALLAQKPVRLFQDQAATGQSAVPPTSQ
jgi:phosphonate transport system substrate-binding protein